jgi:hypothetical protein
MREDLPKDLRTQASALPGRPLKETSDLLLEAATEIEDWRETTKKIEGIAEQGYIEAYKIITDLKNRLESQKEESEKTLEKGFEEAYQMLLEERAKNEKSPQKEGASPEFTPATKRLRKLDEDTMNEFKNIVTIDDTGKAHEVLFLWADDERILSLAEAKNSVIRLPLMHITRGDINFMDDGMWDINYVLKANTLYEEDMNQIIEQITSKFSPIIKKNEDHYYRLTSIANNKDLRKDAAHKKALIYHFNLILRVKKI